MLSNKKPCIWWNLIFAYVEFACNSSVNRSTSICPFEIVTGYQPRKPIDLIDSPIKSRSSTFAQIFTQHLHYFHENIHKNLATNITIIRFPLM